MTRTFLHSFDPPQASPVAGKTVGLNVVDIEDAGIREVLQTPGVAYGAWSILDALLAPPGPGKPFIFREPLGKAREVKVALSGLFGRFVARAYLERYFNLSVFAHLGSEAIDLDRRRRIKVQRVSRGDLPDWVACDANLSSLTVAEAKGCHDPRGPAKTLARAWTQARRVDVTIRGKTVSVKRIAIATRWGMATGGPAEALLSVKDPTDEGEPTGSEEKDALFIGLYRRHIANLIRPLGHIALSEALYELTREGSPRSFQDGLRRARTLLDAAPVREVEKASTMGGLIGGIVTQAGPLVDTDVSPPDQEALARLKLRPVFVGIERELVRAAIEAEPQTVRTRMTQTERADEFTRPDRAGGWIVAIGGGRRIVGGP